MKYKIIFKGSGLKVPSSEMIPDEIRFEKRAFIKREALRYLE